VWILPPFLPTKLFFLIDWLVVGLVGAEQERKRARRRI
jgi:hypothetical protein